MFPETRTSLRQAVCVDGPIAAEAMDRIAALYWKPVYNFVRLKFGKNNEDAQDLTQSFFASAIERDFFRRFDPTRASFRTYVRMAVERYAANEYVAAQREKRGGSTAFEPIGDQAAASESPEQVFEREWQRQLFALALEDLQAHCRDTGRLTQWAVFAAYDLADDDRPGYASLAAQHDIPESQVTNYLAWTRRKLRAFVAERRIWS